VHKVHRVQALCHSRMQLRRNGKVHPWVSLAPQHWPLPSSSSCCQPQRLAQGKERYLENETGNRRINFLPVMGILFHPKYYQDFQEPNASLEKISAHDGRIPTEIFWNGIRNTAKSKYMIAKENIVVQPIQKQAR